MTVFFALTAFASSVFAAEKTWNNSIGMEFTMIPAGSFLRESDVVNDSGRTRVTVVTVTKPFWLGKYEVTQEQWAAVMENGQDAHRSRMPVARRKLNPKERTYPVNNVSWNDAREFITRLNAAEGHRRYRLPTEAEWELAARGGGYSRFFFMNNEEFSQENLERNLEPYAWIRKKREKKFQLHSVGQKKSNPYGLYDIYGNVEEWTQDRFGPLPTDREVKDYSGPESGLRRVICGGFNLPIEMPVARRGLEEDVGSSSVGFRLVLSPE
jgi:formylglycine-generating enzyme required for sulfatase activity